MGPARLFDQPLEHYSRLHHTSGTRGFPLTVLDTPQDWSWWLDCWDRVLDAASVTSRDVAMMAFSFGPFIGFWSANDALARRGALVVPGGGMNTESRLRLIDQHSCTLVCCTPTYALHMAQVASQLDLDLKSSSVTRVLVAGEPGGSITSIRSRIEEAWGACVIDHAGGSEVGAWGYGNEQRSGLVVNEAEFIAEVLAFDQVADPISDQAAAQPRRVDNGADGELVLTSLGRFGGPVIRYRTGDRVKPIWPSDQSNDFLQLDGGVIGRTDDMAVIRGVNVFPSSIEAIVRELDRSAEFRIILSRKNEMDQMTIDLEGDQALAKALSDLLRDRLAMRVEVRPIRSGSLERFEAKAKRIDDRRKVQ